MTESQPTIPSFKDAENRQWNLRISKGRSREILDTCGVDFGQIHDGKLFTDLTTSDEMLAHVLWILVEKQAESRSVTPEDFAEALDGDALDSAMEALVEATILFTRRPIRAAVEKVIRKTLEAQAEGMKTVESWVDANGDQMIAQVKAAATQALSTSGK